ncbi:MAG TPA: FAD-binding oxidoreductase [Geminicoccaceae bacterium]|nr:FAD-binding oxidoreductase [Geminicoccaceae bacterium]
MTRAGLYAAEIYDRSRPVASYWAATAGAGPAFGPLEGDLATEVAIVGGGYTGLSAALHLARDHGIEPVVLEAGPVGWGGSGRNGGFCCLGSAKLGYESMAAGFGIEETQTFFAAQKAAVALVRELAATEAIELDAAGEGELVVAHRPGRVAGLRRHAATVAALFGERWPVLSADELRNEWLAAEEAHGALLIPHGFGLHPLRYAHGLAAAAARRGARIFTSSPVVGWERHGSRHRLLTPAGSVTADRVLLATNGFTTDGLHPALAGRTLPALSAIVVTRPLSAPELLAQRWQRPAMFADTRTLLFYARLLPDRRLLFGARGGTDASPAAFARRTAWMRRRLGERFPAWRDVQIDHAWWGLVCLARDRLPHLGPLPGAPGVFAALAYHGSGVAMAGWFDRAVAALLADRPQPGPLPAFVRSPPPRFPLPGLRLLMLRAAYAGYRLRDGWW